MINERDKVVAYYAAEEGRGVSIVMRNYTVEWYNSHGEKSPHDCQGWSLEDALYIARWIADGPYFI